MADILPPGVAFGGISAGSGRANGLASRRVEGVEHDSSAGSSVPNSEGSLPWGLGDVSEPIPGRTEDSEDISRTTPGSVAVSGGGAMALSGAVDEAAAAKMGLGVLDAADAVDEAAGAEMGLGVLDAADAVPRKSNTRSLMSKCVA